MTAVVIYYSRSGYTRKVAEEIARRIGAELREIEDVRSRGGVFGYLRSAREAYLKRPAEIRPSGTDLSEYDVAILGTPVWAGHVSSPMRSYVTTHQAELNQVALFCTEGGSGGEAVLRELADLCKHEPVSTLAVKDVEIKRGEYDTRLTDFLRPLTVSETA